VFKSGMVEGGAVPKSSMPGTLGGVQTKSKTF